MESLKEIRDRLAKKDEKGNVKNCRCKECGMRVRGPNHEKGSHHISKKAPSPTE